MSVACCCFNEIDMSKLFKRLLFSIKMCECYLYVVVVITPKSASARDSITVSGEGQRLGWELEVRFYAFQFTVHEGGLEVERGGKRSGGLYIVL